MKKTVIILSILITCVISYGQNRFRAGIKAGIITSQVAGDTYSGFNKAGVEGGLFLTGLLNEKWNAQFEMLFIQKGSKHIGDYKNADYSFYLMKLNYIEVPILLQYSQKKFIFEIGPGFGYLINAKEYDYYGEITNALTSFNKTEITANIGINYSLYKNLSITWRYTNSISSIRDFASGEKRWYNPGERNNVLSFSLIYKFGTNESE